MKEQEIIALRVEIERRFKESKLADICVQVAQRFGEDRDSTRGDFYTNIDYIYRDNNIVIDCNIGKNIQGDGELKVDFGGKPVLKLSNSHPERERGELPLVPIHYVNYRMIMYEPGEWEKLILDLSKS